jgi:hypothetical protein
MKIVELVKREHNVKIGDVCEYIEPNVTEDSIFMENGEVIGFFIRDIANYSPRLSSVIAIANMELLSKRVPKSTMKRSSGLMDKSHEVLQYSTILGSVPPKPHMRRAYPTRSSVHQVKSAEVFVKAMLMACTLSEELIRKIAPSIYEKQLEAIKPVHDEWKFGKLFTSSISNYNIAASFHIDNANIKDCVNVIICKRQNSKGGSTTVPDYGATMDSCDNSMLVYPAWRNVHGVTPIIPLAEGGYRNSLVFYPLKAFLNDNL